MVKEVSRERTIEGPKREGKGVKWDLTDALTSKRPGGYYPLSPSISRLTLRSARTQSLDSPLSSTLLCSDVNTAFS